MKALRRSIALAVVLLAALTGSTLAADTSSWTRLAPPDLNVSILLPDAPTGNATDTTDNGTAEHRRLWQDVTANYAIFVDFSVYGANIDPVSTEKNVWGGFLTAAPTFAEDTRTDIVLGGTGGTEFVGHSPTRTVLAHVYVANSAAFAIFGSYTTGNAQAEDIVRTALDSARITGTFPTAIPDSTATGERALLKERL